MLYNIYRMTFNKLLRRTHKIFIDPCTGVAIGASSSIIADIICSPRQTLQGIVDAQYTLQKVIFGQKIDVNSFVTTVKRRRTFSIADDLYDIHYPAIDAIFRWVAGSEKGIDVFYSPPSTGKTSACILLNKLLPEQHGFILIPDASLADATITQALIERFGTSWLQNLISSGEQGAFKRLSIVLDGLNDRRPEDILALKSIMQTFFLARFKCPVRILVTTKDEELAIALSRMNDNEKIRALSPASERLHWNRDELFTLYQRAKENGRVPIEFSQAELEQFNSPAKLISAVTMPLPDPGDLGKRVVSFLDEAK